MEPFLRLYSVGYLLIWQPRNHLEQAVGLLTPLPS
jgi:hypothetical protein